MIARVQPSRDDAEAFRAIYDAEVGYVGRVLLRFGVPPKDLEDFVQEVFVVLHRRRQDFDPTRPLRPWLCGIAYRVASQQRRRPSNRHEVMESGDAREPWTGPSQDRRLAAHEAVQHGLAPLSFEQRSVLVLCDMEGHSAPEAAHLLAVPVGTVYSRLHEARRLFTAAVRRAEEPR